MTARTLVYELMIASPLIFLGLIGYNARTYEDDFVPLSYSDQAASNIRAYSEHISAEKKIKFSSSHALFNQQIREVTRGWVADYHSGNLKSLKPEFAGDTMAEGVKYQIYTAALRLCTRMHSVATQELEAGNTLQASRDSILCLNMLQSVKYSDLFAAGTLASKQRMFIKLFDRALPSMKRAEKKELLVALEALDRKEEQIQPLIDTARGYYHQSSPSRLDIEDVVIRSSPKSIDDSKPSSRYQLIAFDGGINRMALTQTEFLKDCVINQKKENRQLIRNLRDQLSAR